MLSESSTINPSFTSSRLYPPLSCVGRREGGEGGRGGEAEANGRRGEGREGGQEGVSEGVRQGVREGGREEIRDEKEEKKGVGRGREGGRHHNYVYIQTTAIKQSASTHTPQCA